jgi:hypothetical protein
LNNYVGSRQGTTDTNSFDVRFDQILRESDAPFARFSYLRNTQFVPGPFAGIADGGAFSAGTTNTTAYGRSWAFIFDPKGFSTRSWN